MQKAAKIQPRSQDSLLLVPTERERGRRENLGTRLAKIGPDLRFT